MPDAIKKAEAESTESEWVSLNVATQLLSLNREAVVGLVPMSGHELTFILDEIDDFQVLA